MSCYEPQRQDSTRTFMDQMDVIKRFVQQYSSTFMYATSANDMEAAAKDGKVSWCFRNICQNYVNP